MSAGPKPYRRRKLGALLFAVACLPLMGVPARAADQTYALKFSGIHTTDNTQTQTMQKFADLVREKTKGRVVLTLYPNAQLGDEGQLLQAAMLPSYHDMATLSITILTTVDKDVAVTNLPFLFRDEKQIADFELSPAFAAQRDEFLKARGLRMLGAWDSGFTDLFTKRPVRDLADFKGMKIRVPPAADDVRIAQILGANPTPIPFGELYMSLQTGVVDGTKGVSDTVLASRLNEVAKYEIEIHYQVIFFNPVISERFYQSLPEDIRTALNDAARETTIWNRQAYHDAAGRIRAELEKSGMQMIQVKDIDAWRSAVKPIYDSFVKQSGDHVLKMIQAIN